MFFPLFLKEISCAELKACKTIKYAAKKLNLWGVQIYRLSSIWQLNYVYKPE